MKKVKVFVLGSLVLGVVLIVAFRSCRQYLAQRDPIIKNLRHVLAGTDLTMELNIFRESPHIQGLQAGGSVMVTLIFHSPDSTLTTYYRYGKTPNDNTDHWYEFLWNGRTGAQIAHGVERTTVYLHFVDGLRGDDDITANGVIEDVGAPGAAGGAGADDAAGQGSGGGCFISTILGQ